MSEVVGYLPCKVKWSNALRFKPTGVGRCLHFTASTKGTVFVIFSVIPNDKDTWYYVEMSPYGVGVLKVGSSLLFHLISHQIQTYIYTSIHSFIHPSMFGRLTHMENNEGFHRVKFEGLSISFYPGTKTPSIQGAKMEILRKMLMNLSNTNNISDSSESFDQEEQEEEHRLIKVETPEMEDEAEHCHDHGALMLDHVEVHADISKFPPPPQVYSCINEVKKMAAQMQELMSKVNNLTMASESSHQELKQRIKLLEDERDSLLTPLRLHNNEFQYKGNYY